MRLDGKDVLVFGTAVAVGVVALPALMRVWRRRRPKPPSNSDANWKYVGTLDSMTIFPLKSGKGIQLQTAYCTERGLCQLPNEDEGDVLQLRDRYFMLLREDNGEQLFGKEFSTIIKISIQSETKDRVRFSYPGKSDLIVQVQGEDKKIAKLWPSEPVGYLDCGDEASNWMTEVLKNSRSDDEEEVRIRLGYWPVNNSLRNMFIWENISDYFPGISNHDTGLYSDLTSYMLMISSSMDELNRRLQGITISSLQFRPNFYIKTDEKPFSDLTWKWVKIGDIIFRYVKGCRRCFKTTYDPETSMKYPNNEPLTTLNRIEEAKVMTPIEESPMMGIHLGSYNSGIVRVGDPVYVIKN